MKVMLQKSAEKHLTPGVSPGRFCHQIAGIVCIYIYIYVMSIYIKKYLLNIHDIINCLAGFLLSTMRRNQPLCDFIVFSILSSQNPKKKS